MSQSNVQKKELLKRINDIRDELPMFISEYVRGISNTTEPLTRLNYLIDIRLFFTYLVSERLNNKDSIRDITLDDINALTITDLEVYLEYLSFYDKDERTYSNAECAKARKLSAIRSMYRYFLRKEKLTNNPSALIESPKVHQKPIVRLDVNEIANLLDVVESGDNLTTRQKKYHRYTSCRDLALITLFLGTGIRVSELVNTDVDDLDFENNQLRITRKGGNQDIVVFGDEVRAALLDYMLERENVLPIQDHEEALFLSMQKRRISVRSVELLVKKYAAIAAPLKKISPHKLRSTFGTRLYEETGDIYLVADVLGHHDVNTTRKHYAALELERKRRAANKVRLRSDSSDDRSNDE